MTGYIYKITNDINEHIYIGKTTSSLEYRLRRHFIDSRKNSTKKRPLYNAIRKYGEEHFFIHLVEKIDECDDETLSNREQYWIKYYNSKECGYNATLGGDGSTLYDYDEIIKLYNEGMTQKEISEIIGCDRTVVQRCLKGAKIDPFRNGRNKTKIPVIATNNNKNITISFESMNEAARWLVQNKYANANASSVETNISRAVRGIRKTCCGFTWQINPNW